MSDGYFLNRAHQSGTITNMRRVPTKTGVAMCVFKMVGWKIEITCVSFSELAEHILSNYTDGELIEVRGRLQNHEWTSAADIRYRIFQLVADTVIEDGQEVKQRELEAVESGEQDEGDTDKGVPRPANGPF